MGATDYSGEPFPLGGSELSHRAGKCLEKAVAAMLAEDYEEAEGHLEAIGDPSSSSWLHLPLYVALCLISGGSFSAEGGLMLDMYIEAIERARGADGAAAARAAAPR